MVELTLGVQGIGTPALWIGFTVFVLAMLALDLGVFHRKAHEVGVREALGWTAVWVSLALVFNLGVYVWFGSERALEFLTGYVIEKALSVDNIFVFIVVFSAFAVPARLARHCARRDGAVAVCLGVRRGARAARRSRGAARKVKVVVRLALMALPVLRHRFTEKET